MNAANVRVFELLLMLELGLIRGYPTLIIQRTKICWVQKFWCFLNTERTYEHSYRANWWKVILKGPASSENHVENRWWRLHVFRLLAHNRAWPFSPKSCKNDAFPSAEVSVPQHPRSFINDVIRKEAGPLYKHNQTCRQRIFPLKSN